MTIEDDYAFHESLKIYRNKAEMLLRYILNSVVDAIIEGNDPVLPIPTRTGSLDLSRSPHKFEIYLEIMVEIYLNILKGQIRTKRDMYYGNSALFKKQTTLDSSISKLARIFSVPRDALNVVGASKGLYYGEIMINNMILPLNVVNLIPRREEITSIDLLSTKFILIIEKDAVMTVIVDNYNYLKNVLGSFLLICGKGFPCMRTKQFMNLIETKYPHISKYILVDNDPYGIDIVLNYITKSEFEMDACESIEYIGVNHFDLDKHANPKMMESLTVADVRRLETVKKRARSLSRFREIDEIKFMQNNLKKAEIESLYYPDSTSFCKRFLVEKLQGILPSTQPARVKMEEEDIALKKRLLVDERIVRKISKKLLSTNSDNFILDKEQLEFQFSKNLAILKSFERDWSQINSLCQQIDQNILQENEDIATAKSDLLAAKIVLQNRLEYDQIAKEILTLQSRPELLKSIQNVEQEILDLANEIEVVDSRTFNRYAECSQIFESVQLLLENVNMDCKEFK